jgi:proline iminopeptidase
MYAKVNGTRIFFDVDGAGVVFDGLKEVEKPVLLLLPGGPGASHMHYKRPDAGFGRLTERFQTVYIDWRGAARSDPVPPERITLEGTAEDVEAIREMLGIEEWGVLGASGGGIWAIAYAGKYPERVSHLMIVHSIGTCEPFGDTAESMARRAGITDEDAIALYRGFTGGDLLTPVEEWANSLRSTIVTVQNAIYNDPVKHPELVERRTKVWNEMPDEALLKELDVSRWYLNDFQKNYHVKKYADALTMPTFVTTGERDPVAPPSQSEEIQRAIPGAELYIHSGYHMPVGDEQGPFFDKILDFLERNDAFPASPSA